MRLLNPDRAGHCIDNYGMSHYIDAFMQTVFFECVRAPDANAEEIVLIIARAMSNNFDEMKKRSSPKDIKKFILKSKEMIGEVEKYMADPKWLAIE